MSVRDSATALLEGGNINKGKVALAKWALHVGGGRSLRVFIF